MPESLWDSQLQDVDLLYKEGIRNEPGGIFGLPNMPAIYRHRQCIRTHDTSIKSFTLSLSFESKSSRRVLYQAELRAHQLPQVKDLRMPSGYH